MTDFEAAAKTLYELWGGPWNTAPEHRREQARREAVSVVNSALDGLYVVRRWTDVNGFLIEGVFLDKVHAENEAKRLNDLDGINSKNVEAVFYNIGLCGDNE